MCICGFFFGEGKGICHIFLRFTRQQMVRLCLDGVTPVRPANRPLPKLNVLLQGPAPYAPTYNKGTCHHGGQFSPLFALMNTLLGCLKWTHTKSFPVVYPIAHFWRSLCEQGQQLKTKILYQQLSNTITLKIVGYCYNTKSTVVKIFWNLY